MSDKVLCEKQDLVTIANAVREAADITDNFNVPSLVEKTCEMLREGTKLPTLANPGKASDALSGKEFIDADGNKITGTIATKTANNLTASGSTVTVPAGYYASQATKSVAIATQATPSVSIDSAGKITATATQTAGYVAAGTKIGTKQMTVQAAKTITPSTSSQTAVAKNVYTTGAVTVAAIPSKYQDVTTPLADLNAANGGTAATTMAAAVDNAEAHASSQEALIAQITSALDGKAAGGSGTASMDTCTVTVSITGSIGSVIGVNASGAFNVNTVYIAEDSPETSASVTVYKDSILILCDFSYTNINVSDSIAIITKRSYPLAAFHVRDSGSIETI